MIRNLIKSAVLAAAALGAIAATPAAAQRYDRGGYDYNYRNNDRGNSGWNRDRDDRRSWRRDRDDDRVRHHRHWRDRDRYDRYDRYDR